MFYKIKILLFSFIVVSTSANSMVRTLENVPQAFAQKKPQEEHSWSEARLYHYQVLESKPWWAVSKKYITALAQEDKELMQEFFTLVGITESDFDQYKHQWYQSFIESEKKQNAQQPSLDDEYAKMIKRMFELAGVDSSKIIIKSERNPTFRAAAGLKTIYVNPDYIPLNSDSWSDIQTLFHEMIHIMHEDHLTTWLMLFWKDNPQLESFIIKRKHFQEKRADILAMLVDLNVALANVLEAAQDNSAGDATHPSGQIKRAYSLQVYNEMMKAIEEHCESAANASVK